MTRFLSGLPECGWWRAGQLSQRRDASLNRLVLPCCRCRAIRDIAPGEEVTTSYCELAAPRWERRAALLQHHSFDIDAEASGAAAAAGSASRDTTAPAAAPLPPSAAPGSGSAAAVATVAAQQRQQQQQQQQREAVLQHLPAQAPVTSAPLPGGGGELRLYHGALPPWPHDERDSALTAVVGFRGSSGGGMWACLPPSGGAAGAAAAVAAAAASFDIGDDGLEEAAQKGESSPAPASTSNASGNGAASAASQTEGASMVVHCWLERGSKAAVLQQAAELAAAYAAALRLQCSLDGQLAGGGCRAAAALRELQRTVGVLCGGGRPSGGAPALGARHVLRMHLLADVHRAAIAAGEWRDALSAGRQLLPLYQQAYPPVG